MSTASMDYLRQLSEVLSVVPNTYVNAILKLHEKLEGRNAVWIIDGDLAEALRTVSVAPDCIEIVCTKRDAKQIFEAVKDLKPTPMALHVKKLPRKATVEGKEFSVLVRSYSFEFMVDGVEVEVEGNVQYKVGEWDWGEVFMFNPEYVYVVGKKTAVTPLAVRAELYQCLGWKDRYEAVMGVIQRPLHVKPRAS